MTTRHVLAGLRRSLSIVLLLLLSSIGMALGQEASDTGEMSVSVVPSGEVQIPGEAGGAPPPASPSRAGQPAAEARPGTVSAWVLFGGGSRMSTDVPTTQLMVRDDRGTAAGWYVLLSTTGSDSEPWRADLLENAPGTILRILPAGSSPIPFGELQGGRTLGLLSAPIRILEARPGSGAGVFMQSLGILYPGAIDDDLRVIIVHISSGP